jgi:hypothetical protein
MATAAPDATSLEDLAKKYCVHAQVWPQYSSVNGERCQVGYEVELLGSHSLDPSHVNPSCPLCLRAARTLLQIANAVIGRDGAQHQSDIPCEIYTHEGSIVCSPRLENRALVSVTIRIVRASDLIEKANERELEKMNSIKRRLSELGIHEL